MSNICRYVVYIWHIWYCTYIRYCVSNLPKPIGASRQGQCSDDTKYLPICYIYICQLHLTDNTALDNRLSEGFDFLVNREEKKQIQANRTQTVRETVLKEASLLGE